MDEDQLLIKKCRKGSRPHQNMLYEKYKGLVMGISRRYSKSKSEAEDIFQETFIKIFRSLSRPNTIISLQKWIYRISVNTAINLFHQYKKHSDYLQFEFNESSSEDYLAIIDHLQTEVLLLLIQKLPDEYQVVFNMHVIDGYSHREIGEILSIPENTSRSHLHRAKNQLKEYLSIIRYTKYEAV